MYAIEFETPIENGIVRIPKQYQELQQSPKARFVVMYSNGANNITKEDDEVQLQLKEFRRLRSQSNNKVMLTREIAINIDEMMEDGLL